MPWILRITHTVPAAKKADYQQLAKDILKELGKGGKVEHRGSFRVAFGNSREFMHLFEFEHLRDYEETHEPSACRLLKTLYDNDLFTDSRWEWLKPI